MELPKLDACPNCGETPEWFLGYGKRSFASLCLYCKCRFIEGCIPSIAQFKSVKYARRLTKEMAERWEKGDDQHVSGNDNNDV